ncbi:MAG TPA: ferritin-like domain-containing protein [Rhodanobacteraceae bacterium]
MEYASTMRWTLDSIDFANIKVDRIRPNDDLMCLLCASAFIESGSDIYTHNLVEHYRGDAEIEAWLRDHWEHEELQHGRALATYVTHVWPDFDFDAAFKSFIGEYAGVCKPELLEPSRCLEMAARCVVETGTATLYRAIHESTDEPVLKALTKNIKSDEVHHYSHFYHYFQKYQSQQKLGRIKVLRTLWRRLREIGNEDGDIALRHVFKFRHPEYLVDQATFRKASQRVYAVVRHNLSAEMAIKMMLKPLDLPARVNTAVQPPLNWAARRFAIN